MLNHEFYIRETLKLAKRGFGKTDTNPLVGAVLVHKTTGSIIAKGYHRFYGGPHAEVACIANAERLGIKDFSKTILYVNLEPCCHWGKTPPCTDLILSKKIPHVVCGMKDPFKAVSGKGIETLKKSGVKVEYGILEQECKDINREFLKVIDTGMPWVILKGAQTLDGKIASITGDSKWITGETSRKSAHRLRSLSNAVIVGSETVNKDNPELTVRHVKGDQPFRVVLDRRLRTNPNSKIFNDLWKSKTIICTSDKASLKKTSLFSKNDIEVWRFSVHGEKQFLKSVLKKLVKEKHIGIVLVEGGGKVLGSFVKNKLADELNLFLAPKILGDGRNSFSAEISKKISKAISVNRAKITQSDSDFFIRAFF